LSAIPARSDRLGADFLAGANFALTAFSEVRTELGVSGIMIGVDRVKELAFREAGGRRPL
jgi:hypothetical protein